MNRASYFLTPWLPRHSLLKSKKPVSKITWVDKIVDLDLIVFVDFVYRSNNPVLLRFLHKHTSSISDVLVQELVIEVLCCCQDLINPFLSGFLGGNELKLSMSWVANMNLVTKVREHGTKNIESQMT